MNSRVMILAFSLLAFACAPLPAETSLPAPTLVGEADSEMESAYLEARHSLPLFIQRIGTPHPARTFVAVKARFSPPDSLPQDIWVDNVTYRDHFFYGTMGDDIPSLRLFFDDAVTVKPEHILDWMIVEDGKLIGGYTIRLAYKRMSSEEKETFLKTLDYSLQE